MAKQDVINLTNEILDAVPTFVNVKAYIEGICFGFDKDNTARAVVISLLEKANVHTLEFEQNGLSYVVHRLSSDTKSDNYDRFTYYKSNTNPTEEDQSVAAVRYFFERWGEWITISLV